MLIVATYFYKYFKIMPFMYVTNESAHLQML